MHAPPSPPANHRLPRPALLLLLGALLLVAALSVHRAARLLQRRGTSSADDAGRAPRVYVVLGLDLDTPDYAALAPLTAYVWARAFRTPVTPLVLATARDVSRLSPARAYVLNALTEAGARVELVSGASAHHPVTAAQLARLVCAHARAIPFENMDVTLRCAVRLEPAGLLQALWPVH